MRLLPVVVFFCLCVSAFSQVKQAEADDFIEGAYWYRKYLPQEHISEYHALKNVLAYLKENDTEGFEKLGADLSESIHYLNNKAHESLQEERRRVSPKLNELAERYGANEEVEALAGQFAEFERALAEGDFPNDDSCLQKIDELHSRLISGAEYALLNDGTYLTKQGDYLRELAQRFYGDERMWPLIYNANKGNGQFLPDPSNPDLIAPGIQIYIPRAP